MGILDKLIRATDPRAKTIAKDLARLDEVRGGLGALATNYVMSGTDETVLSTIATLGGNNPLEVCTGYVGQKSPSLDRRTLLAQQQPVDLPLTVRYAQVLAASFPSLPDTAAGSKHVPPILRVLFSEIFYGARKKGERWGQKHASLINRGMTLAAAADVITLLGGDITDFIDLLYQTSTTYGGSTQALYRRAVEPAPLLAAQLEAVPLAAQRISAHARCELVDDLARHKLIGAAHHLNFVIALAGDSSKAVRESARRALAGAAANELEPRAIELLATGNVAARAGMVELLSVNASASALAALKAHREKEKTARIVAAIDTTLTVSVQISGEDQDDAQGYTAINGERIDIPPLRPLPDGERIEFGRSDEQALLQIVRAENAKIEKRNEESRRQGHKYQSPLYEEKRVRQIVALLNNDKPPTEKQMDVFGRLDYLPSVRDWMTKALKRMPMRHALALSVAMAGDFYGGWYPRYGRAYGAFIQRYLESSDGDLRHVESLRLASGVLTRGDKRDAGLPGDMLRAALSSAYYYDRSDMFEVKDSVWPYIAEKLKVYDEAFGLAPPAHGKLDRLMGVLMMQSLPMAPRRYFAPLLEAATGETKGGRAEARKMLQQANGVGERIIALLDDSRQMIRAGAAQWLAQRHEEDAVDPLKKRLKKEKSEIAKAAMLTALEALGQDLSRYVGPEALLSEAQKGLKRAKFDKLAWLGLEHLPALHYRDGARLPEEVLKWWLFLAVKLKQPGGNALFDIYLQQLVPADAEKLSSWVFESWINYDTACASEAEANEYAKANAPNRFKHYQRYYEGYTLEQAFAQLKNECMGTYLNSGAATKGLLALAARVPSAIGADHVRAYLKQHGSRTSQASSLLEVMAGIGDPVSLQVIIAAATRLKQKGVQKFAGSLVEKVAEARNWSMDELADRTIPVAGLDDNGVLELVCAEDGKTYTGRLDDTFKIVLQNPAGKTVKSLPAGKDDYTKAAKKQLSGSRRELKQVISMQTARLYEALCSGRVWSVEDFSRDLYQHPIMRRIVERIVWTGLDETGEAMAVFRPTAEGDFTNAEDDDVDITEFATLRLAHGARMSAEDAAAWETHLADYEVKPVFVQFGRTLMSLDDKQKEHNSIVDRKGWVTDTFTIRGAASKLGYERGEALDGGFFHDYIKSFTGAGIAAVIEFSGNCLPEENVAAATISLSFERYVSGQRRGVALALKDVPPVLLSECWNDYHAMAAKGAFAEDWEKKMPWM
ncbi:MAG: DUF4132 domain-containing protein [Gammaproteobacteria bacterium]